MGLTIQTHNPELARILQALPLTVRVRIDHDILEKALRYGLITITPDDKLHWQAGSQTLLTYFCGKMFCGDTSRYNPRTKAMHWHRGPGRMPVSTLSRLFNATSLKYIRNKRAEMPLPDGFQLIDDLYAEP